MKSDIDCWANFLYNEKLVPERMTEDWVLKLITLCETLAKIRRPNISTHQHKLESRKLLCFTAMDLSIDLPSIKHKTTGRYLIGRGLLDAWNLAYQEKHGSTYGTACAKEAKRRDIVTRLSKISPSTD